MAATATTRSATMPATIFITDLGRDDNIQGRIDGNDVIHGGNGVNLIIGGFGSDFIVTGEDANGSFGGQGNDPSSAPRSTNRILATRVTTGSKHATSDGRPATTSIRSATTPSPATTSTIGSCEMDNSTPRWRRYHGRQQGRDRPLHRLLGFDWATLTTTI